MHQGIFIAIEGSDGSGKGTQFKLLTERLKAEGYDVATYDFPQYDRESSYNIREYLNGSYGTAEELGPYTPSLFYALDRFSVAKQIEADVAAGKVVVSNRFTASNMAHQGAKFGTPEERAAFFQWLDQLEFGMLHIPKPDINVVLLVPAETAQTLVDKKDVRGYTDTKRDIHEADLSHLECAVAAYQQLCSTYPETFTAIDCTKDNLLMSIPAINNIIWERITPMLGKLRKKNSAEPEEVAQKQRTQSVSSKANPYITQNPNGSFTITKQGTEYLSQLVTNTDKDVYVFTDKISSQVVAAAMARLSRRGDDMRVTLLDEFSAENGKDEELLRRVITAYGDDSVQQLTGTHFVIENASNLLTKKLEWGRLASYLEQSTRYIQFDQKDERGKYKYYTPASLDSETTAKYEQQMDLLFDKYSMLLQKLTDYVRATSTEPAEAQDGAWKSATRAQACDAARVVLPAATKSTVGVFASGQALESLIMHLQSEELAEAQKTGNELLIEARKVTPTFLERADRPERGGAWIAYRNQTQANLTKLAKERQLQPMKGESDNPVQLTDYWPKNELDTLPHMLFASSTLSLAELERGLGKWSYSDKQAAFKTYLGERLNRRHKPGRAFEFPHYTFDIVCDYGIFRDIQRHRMVDNFEWQQLSPHYGYETPKLVTSAGLDSLFDECFELSLSLYQNLIEAGYEQEAQYATLLGHKMRSKLTLNARSAYHLIEIRTSPQGHPGYRKLASELHDAIAAVHPLIAEGMIFVNKGEDPELTRLAAERATQFKLANPNN